jgi:dihydrodipicolinate reductase
MNINQKIIKLGVAGVCGKMGRRIFELLARIRILSWPWL